MRHCSPSTVSTVQYVVCLRSTCPGHLRRLGMEAALTFVSMKGDVTHLPTPTQVLIDSIMFVCKTTRRRRIASCSGWRFLNRAGSASPRAIAPHRDPGLGGWQSTCGSADLFRQGLVLPAHHRQDRAPWWRFAMGNGALRRARRNGSCRFWLWRGSRSGGRNLLDRAGAAARHG